MKKKAIKGLRSNIPPKIKKNNIGEKRKLPNSWVDSQIKKQKYINNVNTKSEYNLWRL